MQALGLSGFSHAYSGLAGRVRYALRPAATRAAARSPLLPPTCQRRIDGVIARFWFYAPEDGK
jgi:hypothetical protein